MHSLSTTTSHQRSSGFTLIEVMIIAPIVVLVIGGFIALIISMVGDVLLTRDQNTMAYETQDVLDRIEQDTRLSTKFLTTTGTLVAPQGSNSNFTGTAAFTNASNTLIFNSLATDENPSSSTRSLIYYANQPNPCGSQETFNRAFSIQIIYFIKSGSLWRRTIVPDYNHNSPVDSQTVCSSPPYDPWQQNSCSPGYGVATRCQTNDEEVMKNVNALTVQYFGDPNSTTDLGAASAASATTIGVTVTGQKTTAARNITSSASLRATKLNTISTD